MTKTGTPNPTIKAKPYSECQCFLCKAKPSKMSEQTRIAEQVIDDAQFALLPGQTLDLTYLFETAQAEVTKDPLYATALLLELCDRHGLILPEDIHESTRFS